MTTTPKTPTSEVCECGHNKAFHEIDNSGRCIERLCIKDDGKIMNKGCSCKHFTPKKSPSQNHTQTSKKDIKSDEVGSLSEGLKSDALRGSDNQKEQMKCDDCGKDDKTIRIYWKGKNRCEKCDAIFEENSPIKYLDTFKLK